MNILNAFDEYPVENFNSLLRAQSNEHGNGDILCRKLKGLNSRNDTSMAFKSTFVIPKSYTFGRGRLEQVKTLAAKFLVNTFDEIKNNLNDAAESLRHRKENKLVLLEIGRNMCKGNNYIIRDLTTWLLHLRSKSISPLQKIMYWRTINQARCYANYMQIASANQKQRETRIQPMKKYNLKFKKLNYVAKSFVKTYL